MEIQPIVVGTAGHIDHGKSSLVRALTGIDPDRLKEEKERGLTIDLGFARFDLPDGRTVGIVDVPGHERFIRNMVAGATGTDLVVLVVAADDGVMPQTREHLAIMELCGVRRGLIALNKIDLVDEEMVELAAEDVRETVAGTFLEEAEIVRVSAVAGTGMDVLKERLAHMAAETVPRSADGVFRMPIQRVFSVRGFGTVVTGIPVSGQVAVGDVLEVLPSGVRGKVRGLQAYAESTDSGRAGHSTAVNLTDLDRQKAKRGDVIATPNFFSAVRMVGARFRVLPTLGKPVTNRMPVRLHTGTADPLGEIVLLDQKELAPGEEGLVQVRLEHPIVCAPGDRFILRLASPMVTLGGGVILEESRHRLKRFKGFVIDELERQESSLDSPAALTESTLARLGHELTTVEDLAHAVKRSRADTASYLEELAAEGRVLQIGGRDKWIHVDRLEECLTKVRAALEEWFGTHNMRSVMDVLELRKVTGFDAALLTPLLEEEQRRGSLVLESGGRVRPAGREVELDEDARALSEAVLAALEAGGYQPPTVLELAARVSAKEPEVREVLAALVDRGQVRDAGKGMYLAESLAAVMREAIVDNCKKHGQLEIPELKERLQTSRKFLIPLLEYFDTQGLTIRQGPVRVLRTR
jgi:selenocysteine-specific elongation factor